jgi:O-antigen/teichoic acid export membrane protein
MGVRRNTFINLAGSVIPMAVMLITVPLYLKALGDVRYGVLALVWMLLGYFGFLEMGLGKATANQIARLRDASDKDRNIVFWTALLLNGAFGLVAVLILWIVGAYVLTSILKIPREFQGEAIAALPWMLATFPLALISSVLSGALEGRNRFFVVNLLQIASTVVFQIVPLFVVYGYGSSLAVVIPAAVVCRVLMNLPFLVACYVTVPLTLPPAFSTKIGRSLFSYGGWVAVSGMVGPVLETIDRFLIGVVLGAQAVTHYTLPYQLVTKARIIPASLTRALFPAFSANRATVADNLAIISLHSLTAAMTPIILGSIIIMRPFMTIWIGRELASVAAPIGEILLFGVWANGLSYLPYSLLQGKGRPDLVAKFHVSELVPFLVLIWAAMRFFGVYGAAVAWTIRVIGDSWLLFHFSGLRKGLIHVVGMPILMIIFALIITGFLSDASWLLRASLSIAVVSWCGVWFRKEYAVEVSSMLRRLDRYRMVAESGCRR